LSHRAPPTLPLKRLRRLGAAVINDPVNKPRARFYRWYYFPKPQAEEGASVF
jgi:hypothetical protein